MKTARKGMNGSKTRSWTQREVINLQASVVAEFKAVKLRETTLTRNGNARCTIMHMNKHPCDSLPRSANILWTGGASTAMNIALSSEREHPVPNWGFPSAQCETYKSSIFSTGYVWSWVPSCSMKAWPWSPSPAGVDLTLGPRHGRNEVIPTHSRRHTQVCVRLCITGWHQCLRDAQPARRAAVRHNVNLVLTMYGRLAQDRVSQHALNA